MSDADHRPKYEWVNDEPYNTEILIGISCAVDGESWPCSTKRQHVTDHQAQRIVEWRERRLAKDSEHWVL